MLRVTRGCGVDAGETVMVGVDSGEGICVLGSGVGCGLADPSLEVETWWSAASPPAMGTWLALAGSPPAMGAWSGGGGKTASSSVLCWFAGDGGEIGVRACCGGA